MTTIRITTLGPDPRDRRPLKVENHTFTQRDVAMAFLSALFVRHPRTGGGDVAIDGDEITFSAPSGRRMA